MANAGERILFVTGKLAEPALRAVVGRLSEEMGFEAQVAVAKISVAALMTARWLIGKLDPAPGTSRMILPGWCGGDLDELVQSLGGLPIERGPKDLRDLPDYFHQRGLPVEEYGRYDIEILAEINQANRLPLPALLEMADQLRAEGADFIDLGGTPGEPWKEIGEATGELVARGLRVSVDSFDPDEVEAAVRHGAELVLSVNHTNLDRAKDWGCEVVVIPDEMGAPSHGDSWLDSLSRSVETLASAGVPFRIDPVLEPIGFGFAASLGRYLAVRQRFPDAAMMMGIGNLTELTEVDSAGVNAILIGFCQELRIQSILTTQVINWARSAVREIDVARRMMRHAVENRQLPKHLDDRLLLLRDERVIEQDPAELRSLWDRITDPNFRLFAEGGKIVAMNRDRYEEDTDAFRLFERLGVTDPSHAFYLGWEMMKAATALQLGKRYVQDEALRWGFLTRPETSHLDRKRREGQE